MVPAWPEIAVSANERPAGVVNIRPVSLTFEPVHVATISSIVQGVTMTIKPNDIAAIVRDVEPCICGSSSSSVAN